MVKESRPLGISVIIPIYNVKDYIFDCLNSVLTQKISNLEIICVDDESTDGSIQVVEKLMADNSNIKLIRQKHAGAAAARNRALSEVKYKYVSFLDADDMYSTDGILDKLINIAEKDGYNICGCSYWNLLEDGVSRKVKIFEHDNLPIIGSEIDIKDWQNDYGYTNFIFNTRFLENNNICFPNYTRYEDPVFFLKALTSTKKFYVIPEALYICRIGYKDSSELSRSICDILRGILDNIKIAFENDFDSLRVNLIRRLNEEFYNAITWNLSDTVMQLLLDINCINNKFFKKIKLSVLEDLYNNKKGNEKDVHKSEQIALRDKKLFTNIQRCLKEHGGFSNYLKYIHVNKVCIYGAGLYGRLLGMDLTVHGIDVLGYVDRDCERTTDGVRLLSPEEDLSECDILIVSIRDSEAVVNNYKKKEKVMVKSILELTEDILSEN